MRLVDDFLARRQAATGRAVEAYDFAVAWKAATGPRPELQDLPFALRYALVDGRYVALGSQAVDEGLQTDLLVTGIATR